MKSNKVIKANYETAVLGGSIISLLPTWLMNKSLVHSKAPEDLSIVSDFLSAGVGLPQIMFLCIVVIFLPLIEEVIFRNLLWRLVRKKFSQYWTLIAVSIIFAIAHIEPLRALGLIPLSFFLGWLRANTGSIRHSVVAHICNNAVACLLMIV